MTPQFIAKYRPAYNKEVFYFPSAGLLRARKCNYRTIIISKYKKEGQMWVIVGGGDG